MRSSLLLLSAVLSACASTSIQRERTDNLVPDGGEHATGGDPSTGGHAGNEHATGGAGGHATAGAGGHPAGGDDGYPFAGAPPASGGLPGCLMACGYTAQLLYAYSDAYSDLRLSTLRVCRNDVCADGSFASLPTDPPVAETGTGTLSARGIRSLASRMLPA